MLEIMEEIMNGAAAPRSAVDPRASLAGVISSLLPSPMEPLTGTQEKAVFPFRSGPNSLDRHERFKAVVLGRREIADSLRAHYEVDWVVSPTAINEAMERLPNYLVIDEGWLFDGPWARYVASDGNATGILASAVSSACSRRAIIYVWAPEERPDGQVLNISGARYLPNVDAAQYARSRWGFPCLARTLQNLSATQHMKG